MEGVDKLLGEAEAYASTSDDTGDEVAQHLSELGYIDLSGKNDFSLKNQIAAGLNSFESEVHVSGLFTKDFLSRMELVYGKDWLLNLLRLATDVDEGLTFKALPKSGELSLASRIIHYRLDLFGLLNSPVSRAFGEVTTAGLTQLLTYGRYISRLEAINALADIEQFTQRMLQVWGKDNMLVVFRLPAHEGHHPHVSGKFKRLLRKEMGRQSRFYQLLEDHIMNVPEDKVDYNYLSSRTKADLNSFIVRIIQVHQWAEGIYDGLLDNDFGEVTFQSVQTMITLFNEDEDTEEIRLKELVAHVGQGYYMLNAHYLLQHYMVEKAEDLLVSATDSITEQVQNAKAEEQKVFSDNCQIILDQAVNDMSVGAEKQPGLIKRVYYGLKRIFRKIFRFGEKLFKWIVRKVDKIIGFLKSFFKKLVKVAGTALKLFADGIRFLIGRKPIFSSEASNRFQFSQFQLDGDSFSIVTSNSGSDIATHSETVVKTIRSLAFSLEVVEQILKLVKYVAAAALTWPLLLMQLVKAFKEISEKYKLVNSDR